MAALRETSTGRTCTLESEHFIGRAAPPKCSLTLGQPHVSYIHAVVRWTGGLWEIKDLGSRNGTFVNGQRIERGTSSKLERGSRVGFGRVEHEWQLVDDTAPAPMAVAFDTGEPALLEEEVIALPSKTDPHAMIFRGADGGWILERPNEPDTPLSNLQTFVAAGRSWRFCCPAAAVSTVLDSTSLGGARVNDLLLLFSVSRDEEHVHLRAAVGSAEADLGASVYNYLLLTLARHRMADAEQGLPDGSCGWIDIDDLAHDPMMAVPQLNVVVYRIRQQFGRAGIVDNARIIERRSGPGQLRIGTPHLSVMRL